MQTNKIHAPQNKTRTIINVMANVKASLITDYSITAIN